ncbi:MAG: hypothetical protein II875_01610 [Clostridia bacterium]|nr:hypothetical protein [Clostridia bacterium]
MGINAMSLVVFSALNLLVHGLGRCREERAKGLLKVLWIVLLFGNLIRYVFVYPVIVGEVHIPIEYSTVAYFLVPAMMLWNKKGHVVWPALYGLIAGLLYFLTMIAAANRLYADAPPYDVYISYFCHGTLYVNGLLVLRKNRVSDRDRAKTMLCLLIVSVRSLLLKKYAIDADELFIYDVLLGNVIRMVLPKSSWSFTVPLYYVALNALILLTLRGFLPEKRRNRRGRGKKE